MSDPVGVIFAVLFPVLVIGELVLVVLLWRAGGGRLPRVAPRHEPATVEGRVVDDVWLISVWLVATGLLMALGFVAAFVAVHALLFTLGTEAAMVGLIVCGVLLASVPIVVAVMVRRQARHR